MKSFLRLARCRRELTCRPETAIIEGTCLQVWLVAGVWEIGFQEGSRHSKNRLAVPGLLVQVGVVCAGHPLSS